VARAGGREDSEFVAISIAVERPIVVIPPEATNPPLSSFRRGPESSASSRPLGPGFRRGDACVVIPAIADFHLVIPAKAGIQ
jgi:hypothetical protein